MSNIKKQKKPLYAVYKCTEKTSPNYLSLYYSRSYDGLKVGYSNGTNECVLISDDLDLIHGVVNNNQ
jgi:hypothetical protein